MLNTKYSSAVDNDELLKLGEIELTLEANINIESADSEYGVFNFALPTGTAYKSDIPIGCNSTTLATEGVTPAPSIYNLITFLVPQGKTAHLRLMNKYKISEIRNGRTIYFSTTSPHDAGNYHLDLSELKYLPLDAFSISRAELTDITGSINDLNPDIRNISIYCSSGASRKNTNIYGDLSKFTNLRRIQLTKMQKITGNINNMPFYHTDNDTAAAIIINTTNIEVDLSWLSDKDLSGLAYLQICSPITQDGVLNKSLITGDLSNIPSTLPTTIRHIAFNGTDVTGDVSLLAKYTGVIYLELAGSKVSGDITDVVTNCTKLLQLTLPSTVTITDEQKTTLTNRGCTVTIG